MKKGCRTRWTGCGCATSTSLPQTLRRRAAKADPPGFIFNSLCFQQPLQIDETMRAALRSSRSTAGSPVPSAGPPTKLAPPPESDVPAELVPGAVGCVPNAPPVVVPEWCDPMPEPRLYAAVEKSAERTTQPIANIRMTSSFDWI